MPATYPDAAEEEKFILVDQSEMFLGAYEYGKLVFSFPIAVGIEDTSGSQWRIQDRCG